MQFLSEPTRRLRPGRLPAPGPTATATSSSSTARRSGARRRTPATTRMCLARTNWDVPKHRGLTMFIVKIHQPGVQIDQIRAGRRLRRVLPGVLRRRGHPRRRRGGRGRRRLDGGVAPACSTSAWRSAAARPTPAAARSGHDQRRVRDRVARAPGRGDRDSPRTAACASIVAEAPRRAPRQLGHLVERVSEGMPLRRDAATGVGLADQALPRRVRGEAAAEAALEIGGVGRGGVAGRAGGPRRASSARAASPVRRCASAAGATRSSATSSANGCSACPGSGRPTATSPTAT